MERCRVRFAVAADGESIARVHVSGWEQGHAGLRPGEYLSELTLASAQQFWAEELSGIRGAEQSVRYLVAEFVDGETGSRHSESTRHGGDVVGFCAFGPGRDLDTPEGFGELQLIYVSPQYWGRGVSSLLLQRAEAELHAAGFAAAYLWVLEGNARARRFHRRHGWREIGLAKEDERYPGSPREVQYRRPLA
jgi:GNAT superfamily N-acetyltransferase